MAKEYLLHIDFSDIEKITPVGESDFFGTHKDFPNCLTLVTPFLSPPPTQEQAWDFVIEKWDILRRHPEIIYSGGKFTCIFCHLYYDKACKDCPIAKFTRDICCRRTPYEKLESLETDYRNEEIVGKQPVKTKKEIMKLREEEYQFLLKLRNQKR